MGKLYGLLGHPVAHSLSPLMHNDAFKDQQLPYHYQAFDVEPSQLKQAVVGLKALGVSGFNVTIPHKVEVMKYLDAVDEEAKIIGAVNTVVNENGTFIGYNTDGRGYLQSLLTIANDLSDKHVLVVGAGGAARAIVTVLSQHETKTLTITNRTKGKAELLADECRRKTAIDIVSLAQAAENIAGYDVIINTTSVGMSPNIDDIPLSLEHLKESAIVSDLIYNPFKTKWLHIAEEKGATIHNGIGMFVGQGALAFEKWTGIRPDLKRMEEVVIKHLGGK
ncbi:shikimate dehydrogenase [Desertibacillus haloalkaliphilus]|uniref:shikimate dehydrogenase n=1 Tax=Desertibacillus haloalkaliphilus TaxID=1328930 RepID=UPI001C280847|nr:shikimate dehydrogenase [Desertibacillus haloalkaliphilus]MBU8905609.1 shikimate dehydrogenase [Desertibacillus haloalkaliphilus]